MKPVIKNIYGRKKKILIVRVESSSAAAKVFNALREAEFENVEMMDSTGTVSYPALYSMAQKKPDYVLRIKDGKTTRLRTVHIENIHGQDCKKVKSTWKARKMYRHHFRMIGIDPKLSGVYRIPDRAVQNLPNADFYYSDTPALYLTMPDSDSAAQAVVSAVRQYFNDTAEEAYKEAREAENNNSCKNCLYGTVSREE